ncbi:MULTISPECIES: HdeD family acid-resistance protein [Streptomyces]|uniref:HdeD family acid-resistance protein n=1 Tax=Streptomyces morookaense TaxID=1970 RepID=A0A7Y7E6I0_STRMO|nr:MULTISPECIES: HdeD family acid-resistance protein [Streptomyces]MCC2278035.1 HdeD family acid-resistance protein [Streptomyces sp. ET3-23]NVK77416.1 HdeD family acid-resistance protein [Streptomyces morookaense]GHF21604.1 membrane protein [Streptomyces morookaense]
MTSSPHTPGEHHGTEPQGFGPGGGLEALARAGWQILLSTAVASVALGVIVLAWPRASLTVVGVLFGIYLLAVGVFQLAGAFGHHIPGHMRALGFISGGLCVLLGLVALRGPAQSILLLALWIGFGWLLRGVMLTGVALSTPALPARGWQLFLGIISVLAGIVMVSAPFHSIAVLTLVTGILLVALGLVEAVHGIQLRARLGRTSRPAAPGTTQGHRWHLRPQH